MSTALSESLSCGGDATRHLAASRKQTPALLRAHLLGTTTIREEDVYSLSSLTGGEGWGEEADFIEYPSPRSFLAGRGREFLVVVSRCAPLLHAMMDMFLALDSGALVFRSGEDKGRFSNSQCAGVVTPRHSKVNSSRDAPSVTLRATPANRSQSSPNRR